MEDSVSSIVEEYSGGVSLIELSTRVQIQVDTLRDMLKVIVPKQSRRIDLYVNEASIAQLTQRIFEIGLSKAAREFDVPLAVLKKSIATDAKLNQLVLDSQQKKQEKGGFEGFVEIGRLPLTPRNEIVIVENRDHGKYYISHIYDKKYRKPGLPVPFEKFGEFVAICGHPIASNSQIIVDSQSKIIFQKMPGMTFNIRLWIESQTYTGYTKKGIIIPEDRMDELLRLLKSRI